MTPEKEAEFREALNNALDIGEEMLKNGAAGLDAIEKTLQYLEDVPLFNAGRGAVFTHEGRNEMDASIMDGKTLNAGAVGGLTKIKHPISVARAVMDNSSHVLLTGAGAEEFAIEQGLEVVDPKYFYTDHRWKALEKAKAEEREIGYVTTSDTKFGTVGCVVLDKHGNLAAGTTTGGMTNKKYNRLGDTPIIAAGTYANNNTCAVSSTGHGEYFIRYVVAYDISALMEYKGMSLVDASEFVINKKLVDAGGSGGIIAVDKLGNVSMPFNSEGMYRGFAKPNERQVKIYKKD